MKKAFTLIELIFSMVIIAIAFSVLPKILQLSMKTATTNLKEEAMYNAVAYIGLIKSTTWDENNTNVDDILLVTQGNSAYECNTTTGYRKGGMIGSRNCFNEKNASTTLGKEGSNLDDMDDFVSSNVTATDYSGSRDYNLSVSESYINDMNLTASQYTINPNTKSTNTKYITVTVETNKKAKVLGKTFVKIPFIAQNIGQIKINRRSWQ